MQKERYEFKKKRKFFNLHQSVDESDKAKKPQFRKHDSEISMGTGQSVREVDIQYSNAITATDFCRSKNKDVNPDE